MALKIFTNLPSGTAAPAQNAQAPVVADQATPANKECDNSPSFFMEDRNNDGIIDKKAAISNASNPDILMRKLNQLDI